MTEIWIKTVVKLTVNDIVWWNMAIKRKTWSVIHAKKQLVNNCCNTHGGDYNGQWPCSSIELGINAQKRHMTDKSIHEGRQWLTTNKWATRGHWWSLYKLADYIAPESLAYNVYDCIQILFWNGECFNQNYFNSNHMFKYNIYEPLMFHRINLVVSNCHSNSKFVQSGNAHSVFFIMQLHQRVRPNRTCHGK